MANAFMECPEETLARLNTDRDNGLTARQVEESRKVNGENSFSKSEQKSLFCRIWEAATEPMLIMLVIAAVITLGVNVARYVTGGEADFLECIGIFVAISLSVVITVVMEGRSAKAFETLSRIGEDIPVKVIRDGKVCLIPRRDVVLGDILCVETGDKLPADGRLLESHELMADESALTGESMPVHKEAGIVFDNPETPVAERRNLLYSGCFITGGNGKIAVTGVGDHTEFGKIARELASADSGSTPLQEKMAALGKRITVLGSTAAAVVFLVQLIIFLSNGTASLDTVSEAFITSIVLIVAAVPEGLPTIVAVSLALNIIKMSKQNALVRKMIACETVGCINVVCSDKTGTLTQNRMTVTDIFSHMRLLKPDRLKNHHLLDNFCLNSTADVTFADGQVKFIGNPTECALLFAAREAGRDYEAARRQTEILHVYPFSSETKYMATVVNREGEIEVLAKGSPERIMELCSLTAQEREAARQQIVKFQEKACRVIGFAHRRTEHAADYEGSRAALETDMVFDGFTAITDPIRTDVYQAVERCRHAGIELKMLTGDNLITARAIADELGILDAEHIAVEAREIERLSDEELQKRIPSIRVIARSTPSVKMRVVNALKSLGNVVAVTGDGINDAPALKHADVGIAMGITGTEVSKEASDIVLLDDSFSTIVKAIQWGRGIYENFQRFIQFQLTVNLSSVIVVLASILAGFAAPFTALQLLWINIIMDGPPALTLGLEPIRGDLMNQRPTPRNASIVSGSMLSRIAINGVYMSIVFMAQHSLNFLGGSETELPTVLFTLFVVFQLFNALNSRELTDVSIFKNIANNRLMLGVFGATFGLQFVITQFGGMFFNTVPLSAAMWGKILATGSTVVLLSEGVKMVKRGAAAAQKSQGAEAVC